ncbi:MAG: zinc-binding dehydrogenase [Chloroflexi bacterium]|nr:zinc-binding dehydrogenase [Chloroflexota bacterium]
MKAVRFHEFGSEDVLRLEEIPEPTPSPSETLVRIKAVAVNPADLVIRAGHWRLWPIPLPFVLGVEGAGIVEKGRGRFKAGDQVIVSGGPLGSRTDGLYAELVAVPETLLVPVPKGISLEQAATVPSAFLTAYLALLHTARLKAGEWALVTGASGGVGGAAVQVAKALGAQVITTVGSQAKHAKAEALGADYVIDLSSERMAETVQRVTNGSSVEVGLDTLGGDIVAQVLATLMPGGRLVMVGYTAGPSATLNIFDLLKPINLYGFNLFAIPSEIVGAAYAQILAWLADGTIQPVVDRTLPLAQAAEAHRHMAARQAFGRVVLTM